mgnify:FL=1
MSKSPRRPFGGDSNRFDRDLDAILNRVYASTPEARFETATVRKSAPRTDQSSLELKQALADLRDRRTKSQNTLKMKEEVDYLQSQVAALKELNSQIEVLRKKLAEER